MKSVACAACFAVVVMLAAGCGSVAAPPRFHTLMAHPSAAGAPAGASAAPIAWEVLPVLIPAQVDRPQWVVRAADSSLAVLEQERWIAPLAAEMQAAIAERLTESLGASRSPTAAPHKPWRVRVDVQRFDSLPGKTARLDANWTISTADVASLHCRGSFEHAAGASFPALADAHRQALRRLADAIGAGLTAVAAGQPASCG